MEATDTLRRSGWTAWMDQLWKTIGKHPFLSTALLCLLSAALFLTSDQQLAPVALFGLLVFALGGIFVFARIQYDAGQLSRVGMYTALVLGCVASITICVLTSRQENNAAMLTLLGFGIAIILFYSLFCTKRLTAGRIVALLFFLGFLLRLAYILYTSIYLRQHDVEGWDGSGHLGYIMQLYQNHALPEGDVREFWQFYHPPFHHLLEAVWVSLLTGLGMDLKTTAAEGMQFLTLFYSTVCMVIFYRLLRAFGVKGRALVLSFAIVAFHPTFILLGGSVNNDILSITLMLGAILCTVQWYRKQTVKNILKIALCIGLGMMTKLSAWMVAPGVAVVFLAVLIQNRSRFRALIGQFCAFGGVCVPLGLWWSVRNFLSHGVSPAYVPGLGENNYQYIGNFSVLERLFRFDFTNIYHDIPNMENINPLMELLKSAMFDELSYAETPWFHYLLFWAGVVLAVVAFVAMLIVLIRKNQGFEDPLRMLFGITYLVILGSYYLFCFQYPHMCTENARYVVPLIVFGGLFIGMLLQGLRERKTEGGSVQAIKLSYGISAVLIGLFAVAATVTYVQLGNH